ncbi:GAF and ANTAR domain-containing protein [Kutzneria sp. CA-103260]|uniref:GAF and ANTAR domain-containing protein n=1 Tax=Kutzneria sp. CA-103260 TaxID=2802641 RepID=UPI001BAAABDB|nr:GAF and ANTAR domain-containing protein [Kutzneria sp. CA-103260]QUQ67196.1 ANTAR domain-containing protein [Kutzneria sp. CA-103260]
MVIEQEPESIYQEARARARAEGTPVSVRHVASVCHEWLGALGVGVYLLGDLGVAEPACATTDTVERMIELQITLGEGPALTAVRDGLPVLVADLSHQQLLARWPVFGPDAAAESVSAVFAFPLLMGQITVGVLEVYRAREGALSSDELDLALAFAEVMTSQLINQVVEAGALDEEALAVDEFHGRWQTVHQATGMVSVQLSCTLAEALLRLRGHAYATDRRLSDVADDVIGGVLRLRPNDAPGIHRSRDDEHG